MTNKHASKQHGAAMHNEQRPKSKLRKRNNKHKSVAKKAEIIAQRRAGTKPAKAEKTPAAKKAAPKDQ
ncbi:hypothetical protein HOG17_01465 [Candidatus Peregrinibacteria bacterium]|jgi:hypothetical protein|nr:hypothetical protein [Candidatus Peregrinibacteria bacterium]MBT4148401.1 hypothetical protein [Candidatus Peregrinibacteria bacterium]MBT4366460.1 hypothetical protein [Candidatus Peregrinibacteria bacterium]MBT4456089.1 hypothetical protein [Candidatus Peregrinibacteria bacterium]